MSMLFRGGAGAGNGRQAGVAFVKDLPSVNGDRQRVALILNHPLSEILWSLVVFASLACLVVETDESAAQEPGQGLQETSPEIFIINQIFVVVFIVELALNLYVNRLHYFDGAGILNTIVTVFDVILGIVELFMGSMPEVAILRCFRLIRLLRLLRVVRWFPELGFLVAGIASAFMTVLWGVIMVLIILLMFSLLAVQVLHPINLEVASHGTYHSCPRCSDAFGSVWAAFLTFTQTLVFGDSWGTVALPIIEEKWWAIGIFLTAFASVMLAAMNLILAAIVDSGAQAREAALQARHAATSAAEAEERRRHAERLMDLCKELDTDDSGRLSKQELLNGFDRNESFKREMQAMNCTREDVEVFFNVLDRDCNGDVDYSEFLSVMRDTKRTELHQMMTFVKFAVMDLWCRKEREASRVDERLREVLKAIEAKPPSYCQSSCPSEAPPSPRGPQPKGSLARQQQRQPLLLQDSPLQEARVKSRRQSSPEGLLKVSQEERPGVEAKRRPLGKQLSLEEKKEQKSLSPEACAPSLVGAWHPLEAASDAHPSAQQRSPDLWLKQEMVQVLRSIAQETERHCRILSSIEKTVASHTGTSESWASPRSGDCLRPAKLDASEPSRFGPPGPQAVADEPPPPPASAHVTLVKNRRVGL